MRLRRPALFAAALVAAVAGTALAAAPPLTPGVRVAKVGINGNEPLIAIAPDGTIYIAALQYVYRSTDHGRSWRPMPLPPESGVTEYKTDSSIYVDPSGRLYYTFDYPYAGSTAVCTSVDKAATWQCDPATLPGGTDRMWIVAPTASEAYVVTNEGAYQPVISYTTNGGSTWSIGEQGGTGANPYTGRPFGLAKGAIFQPANVGSTVQVDIYARTSNLTQTSPTVNTHLPAAYSGPSGGETPDGVLYVASEAPNAAGGRGVVIARSADQGKTWVELPPITGSDKGTSVFSALAVGKNGHVGVLTYWTPLSKSPDSVPENTPWYARWVDTSDARSAHPHWRVVNIEKIHHVGLICRGLGCDIETSSQNSTPHHTASRFAGDFMGAWIEPDGHADLTWMGADKTAVATPVDPSSVYGEIHFARIAPKH